MKQPKPRNIFNVLSQLIIITPIKEDGSLSMDNQKLRRELEWLKQDFSYKAPEQYPECWKVLGNFINEVFPEKLTRLWQVRFIATFTAKTQKETRTLYYTKSKKATS